MGFRLDYSSLWFRDGQDEPPLAICPYCLGEIYRGQAPALLGAELYHAKCCERMEKDGNRRYLPHGG